MAFARRSNEFKENHLLWKDETVEIAFSNKHFNAAKDAVKWVFDNGYKEGSKCQVALPLDQHTSNLLIELKLGDAEPDDE